MILHNESYVQHGGDDVHLKEVHRLTAIINQFISSCSASMRAPLKTIEDLVMLLQQSNFPEADREAYLKIISLSLQKMERMLDELEHFLENSRREVVNQSVDLVAMTHEILDEHHTLIDHAGVEVSISIEQHLAFNTDASRLHLALSNVIDNAIRFSDVQKKKRVIDIQANVNINYAVITISDNGIGITEELQSKVFDMFFKGSDQSQGVGIGLYVVREVLDKMNGSISLQSTYGQGSKFLIWVPNKI